MGSIIWILVFVAIAIILFLVFREVICWYWKINSSVALLTEIRDLLAAKGNLQGGLAPVAQQSQKSVDDDNERSEARRQKALQDLKT